ncbi:MAG TPA: DUF308 domain-containing protein, partial [Candidatus Krumholzibacteria bacterium]|nr:DUF308 domain-containing protein [Candidatus Krumholzibacteria bacterium]
GLLGCAGIAIGVLSLLQAFRGGGWGAAVVGGLSLLFGLLIMFNPLLTGVAWVYLYAGASLIGGVLATIMAFRLRKSSGLRAAR